MKRDPSVFACGSCSCDAAGLSPDREWEWPELPNPDGSPLVTRQCLARTVSERGWHLVALFEFHRRGNLLVAGGVYDQPAAYLEAMDVIGRILGDGHGQGHS